MLYNVQAVCTNTAQVKHNVKAHLTISSRGSMGGEGPRTHVQVLANSIVASVLILFHYRQLNFRNERDELAGCWPFGGDVLVVGIVR